MFLAKHKKEHTALNMRFLKVTEDVNLVLNEINPVKKAVDSYATVLACLVEFDSIEHALALQDENDREDMQLLGKNKKLKIPEIKSSKLQPIDSKLSTISINKELNTKGVSLSVRNSTNRHRTTSIMKSQSEQATEITTIEHGDNHSASKVGPVEINGNCLSCQGVPSHVLEKFKLACISYKPSKVPYRSTSMPRKQLLQMRRALIDKCNELINSGAWPTQGMNTGKIFKDLISFFSN